MDRYYERRLHLLNGDVQAAAEAVETLSTVDRPVHLNRPDVVTLVACLLPLYRGEALESVRLCEERLSELHHFDLRFFLPETYLWLGKSLAAANQVDKAISSLEEGLQEARTIGSRWSEWLILLALAQLQEGEQAALFRAQALKIVISIAENVGDSELRQSFLNRTDIQGLTGGQSDLTALKVYSAG